MKNTHINKFIVVVTTVLVFSYGVSAQTLSDESDASMKQKTFERLEYIEPTVAVSPGGSDTSGNGDEDAENPSGNSSPDNGSGSNTDSGFLSECDVSQKNYPPGSSFDENSIMDASTIKWNVPGKGNIYFTHKDLHPHTFSYKASTFEISNKSEIKQYFFDAVEYQMIVNLARQLEGLKQNNQRNIPQNSDFQSVESVKSFFSTYAKLESSSPVYRPFDMDGGSYYDLIGYFNQKTDAANYIFYRNNVNMIIIAASQAGYDYDYPQLSRSIDQIAGKLVELHKANSLASYAQKPNIFGPRSMLNLAWVYMRWNSSTDNWTNSGCYFTGVSPYLLVYADSPTDLTLSLGAPVTYSYPALTGTSWEIETTSNGILLGESKYKGLYYEYDKRAVHFSVPQDGWLVKSDNLDSSITKIAKSLALNAEEQKRMRYEIQNALQKNQITLPYILISLAQRDELNLDLPLYFSTRPDRIYRFHFLLSGVESYREIPEPVVEKIERSGLYAVELGARVN